MGVKGDWIEAGAGHGRKELAEAGFGKAGRGEGRRAELDAEGGRTPPNRGKNFF